MIRFGRKRHGGVSGVVGPGIHIEGTLRFKGIIRVDGHVRGRIESEEGTVIVGDRGVIEADVRVGRAVVMGEVTGTIEATEKIEILRSARMTGELWGPVISIDPGARFDGNCGMKKGGATGDREQEPPARGADTVERDFSKNL
jgi:cytoskeletal protein CcmA (bactofilin family)